MHANRRRQINQNRSHIMSPKENAPRSMSDLLLYTKEKQQQQQHQKTKKKPYAPRLLHRASLWVSIWLACSLAVATATVHETRDYAPDVLGVLTVIHLCVATVIAWRFAEQRNPPPPWENTLLFGCLCMSVFLTVMSGTLAYRNIQSVLARAVVDDAASSSQGITPPFATTIRTINDLFA